ncbi:flagellar hook-basal body complex protein FliE [Sulfitobacter donghicola]|uniref:Flagellar hook-basal body complex protein FliE n=1 Tax=Sulfitobacter donghicola DSW-25 = KCTC 12864 = JCM 14565 TaxID=1300350 RepID=A0A073ILF6_9RHOB|nr:flagellar hook-basal body complex protein FliE [Sulfitobacter donghicola]KEJ90554.1 flagellar hook-basal body protein FliE [Sulfitobacter donghicola DSW-25 = KCTC 12864 = JCM 14565]KIN67799.1 Flagellar hook-basal body complex protein FliE [Sulfitobacter donghicola DSW-25 = KCTC 12864 = JCM 14565]
MELKSLSAVQNYTSAKSATTPAETDGGMASTLKGVAGDFAATLAKSEQVAQSTMMGSADPHALVQALAQTELAVETAVSVRNKVVEAYQEILRMPV